jgi:hypothetical protein
MDVKVILLGHKARVGKDTLGNFLIAQKGFKRYGFADKLKDVVSDLYSFSHEQVHSNLKDVVDERYNLSPRQILQDFGQEQRTRHPDIWALYVANQILKDVQNQSNTNFVITDFRFPNEFHSLRNFLQKKIPFLYVIPSKIVRPGLPDFAGMNDVSETALDDFHLWKNTVINNSSVEEFYKSYEQSLIENGITL